MNAPRFIACFLVPAALLSTSFAADLPRLRVSDNQRFLQTVDGQPFFWLGDTAWELFHRASREEAIQYLDTRAAQGFTVVQAVALAEFGGLDVPNAYGHLPLIEQDPTRPAVKDGPDNDYWDHVDFIVREANRRGLRVGFLPTWGDKWNKKWGQGPEVFTPENAKTYGAWLGKRYRDAGLVWILGGDRPIESDRHRAIIDAMASGLKEGDGGAHLITFHPMGGAGSSQWFHEVPWLAFNMRQNGHEADFSPRYATTRQDYDRKPVKPVLDGEPLYEGHPVAFNAKEKGISLAADVRRAAYWDLFSGACGHTYGHHSIWQMWTTNRPPKNNPIMPWFEAIEQPGGRQMQHARHLFESRPYFSRIPDDGVIVASSIPHLVPGVATRRFVATRDADGSYAMVYAPCGHRFAVKMDKVTGPTIRAWWFNPRDGSATKIGEFPAEGERTFVSPDPGEQLDWVLVLDDAAKNFGPPGAKQP